MNRLRKIIYYRKAIIKREVEVEGEKKTITINKIIQKYTRKKYSDILELEREGIRFVLFPKRLNCKYKSNNHYFLVGKYPNATSKNYFIGKFTFEQIRRKLHMNNYDFQFTNKFNQEQLEEFAYHYFDKKIRKKLFRKFEKFIKEEYNIELEKK